MFSTRTTTKASLTAYQVFELRCKGWVKEKSSHKTKATYGARAHNVGQILQRRLMTMKSFLPRLFHWRGKCSVLFAGQDITGDDRVVMGHLRPHNQYLTYICWVRYDRAWAKCSVALVMSTSPWRSANCNKACLETGLEMILVPYYSANGLNYM